jgi:predicted MFS family arabinose efflux permease
MLLGFISFAVFAGIWTVMAFQLHTLGYEADVVGYVGLVSVAGALSAGWFGGLADRRGTLFSGTIGWLVTLLALGVYFAAGQSLAGVVVASLFFSVGTQTTQISNQTRNFALSDDARSRINTIYMASNFIGGATGAFVAATLWERGGWPAVCEGLLAATACMGLVLAVYARSRMKYR